MATDVPYVLQESMLREALNQANLREVVPPVVALSFGIIPLAKRSNLVYVAARPDLSRECRAALDELLPVPFESVPFDADLMMKYLRALNQQVGGVNLPTFTTPDFLTDPLTVEMLREEKVEQGIEPFCELPADEIILLEYRYSSELQNLDASKQESQNYAGTMDVPFRVRGEKAEVYRAEATGPEAVLVCRRQFAFRGTEQGWGIGGQVVAREKLPYVVHPSEIQLRGVTPAELVFHVYDRDEILRVDAGETPQSFVCDYFFLDGGQRQHRRLKVATIGIWRMKKAALAVAEHEEFGDSRDLDLWFDFDD